MGYRSVIWRAGNRKVRRRKAYYMEVRSRVGYGRVKGRVGSLKVMGWLVYRKVRGGQSTRW